MKRNINNKVYDTDTARFIGKWDNGLGGSDFQSASLYKKKTGEYFLCTQTAKSRKDPMFYERIAPISVGEAKAWAKDKLAKEEYLKEFSPRDDEYISMTVQIPKSLHREIQNNSIILGTSMSEELVRCMRGRHILTVGNLLFDANIKCPWRLVTKKGEVLCDQDADDSEREIAGRYRKVTALSIEDGVLVIECAKYNTNYTVL